MSTFHRKTAAVLIAVLAFALMLTGCGGGATSPSNQREEFRVGMECGYPPFNWTQVDDSNGGVPIDSVSWAGGYDVEIAKIIAEALDRELIIVKTEWNGLAPSLTSGRVDAVIAGMSDTEERRQTIDFTDRYYTSDIVVVVRGDSPFANAQSIHEFAGAQITGQLGTLHYDFIDQMTGVDKQSAMESFPVMTLAVSSGKVDGYVTERPGAMSAIASNPELILVGFEGDNGFDVDINEISVAIGLAKDSPYKDDINRILATISEEQRQQLMADALANQPMNVD